MVLIARLIADMNGLETRLDTASAQLAEHGMPIASAAMLDFCGKHDIVSEIEKIDIKDVNEAYERVLKSDVRYRFVIDMASLDA